MKSPEVSSSKPYVVCFKRYLSCLEIVGGRNPSSHKIKSLALQQSFLAISSTILEGSQKLFSTMYLNEGGGGKYKNLLT